MSEYMIFCLGNNNQDKTDEGYQKNYRVFNQDVDKEEFEKVKSSLSSAIEVYPTRWSDKKDMSKEEKDEVSGWSEMGGHLKTFSYEEAWKNWWGKASQEDKDKILKIKYFDSKIFKGITGIEVKEDSLIGSIAEVRIGGKVYKAKIVED